MLLSPSPRYRMRSCTKGAQSHIYAFLGANRTRQKRQTRRSGGWSEWNTERVRGGGGELCAPCVLRGDWPRQHQEG